MPTFNVLSGHETKGSRLQNLKRAHFQYVKETKGSNSGPDTSLNRWVCWCSSGPLIASLPQGSHDLAAMKSAGRDTSIKRKGENFWIFLACKVIISCVSFSC